VEVKLGRIASVKFGLGGYQDSQIGLSFTLEGQGWGVGDFYGGWSTSIDSKGAQWTEADRNARYAETLRYLNKLLVEAKKEDVNGLRGIPVEVTFDRNILKSWRILTEVL